MENQLQTTNYNQNILLTNKEIDIATALWHVNQIVTYPLSDTQLEAWAMSINELLPELEIKTLEKAIKLVKMGKIKWESGIGLPNVFSAIDSSWQYNDTFGKFVG